MPLSPRRPGRRGSGMGSRSSSDWALTVRSAGRERHRRPRRPSRPWPGVRGGSWPGIRWGARRGCGDKVTQPPPQQKREACGLALLPLHSLRASAFPSVKAGVRLSSDLLGPAGPDPSCCGAGSVFQGLQWSSPPHSSSRTFQLCSLPLDWMGRGLRHLPLIDLSGGGAR